MTPSQSVTSHPSIVSQADKSQERELQLPSHRSQQENPPHPAQDVVSERWELPRTPLLHSLDQA